MWLTAFHANKPLFPIAKLESQRFRRKPVWKMLLILVYHFYCLSATLMNACYLIRGRQKCRAVMFPNELVLSINRMHVERILDTCCMRSSGFTNRKKTVKCLPKVRVSKIGVRIENLLKCARGKRYWSTPAVMRWFIIALVFGEFRDVREWRDEAIHHHFSLQKSSEWVHGPFNESAALS